MARKANKQAEKHPLRRPDDSQHPKDGAESLFASPFAALKSIPVRRTKTEKKRKERPPQPAPSSTQDEGALFSEAMHRTTPLHGKGKKPPAAYSEKTAPTSDIAQPNPLLAKTRSPTPDADENQLFAMAMTGVAPVTAGGRDLNPGPGEVPAVSSLRHERLDALLHGTLEFALAYSEEFIEGRVSGLDQLVMGKLRSGQFSHEGHLDLHGQNVEQAYASLGHFLRESYHAGKRHLLLITGRGRNSPGGAPVLRERIQAWLTRDPFKRVVLAFCTAQPRDGGAGAVYLLIRKRKKNQGKIVWDRMPTEEELLL